MRKDIGKDRQRSIYIPLFTPAKQILYNGCCAGPPNARRSWDFDFVLQIPDHAEEYENLPTSRKWAFSVHELPPSLYQMDGRCSGQIQYYVKAKAYKHSFYLRSWDTPKFKTTEPIILRRRDNMNPGLTMEYRRNQIEIPPPKYTTVVPEINVSKWFKKLRKPSQNSVKETMDLQFSAPSRWELGDVQPLSILLQPRSKDRDSKTGQLEPKVRLLSIEHEITATTLVRIPGEEKYSDDGSVEIVSNGRNCEIQDCCSFKTATVKGNIRVLEEGKRLDLGKELGVVVSKNRLPNFESYNISRTYSSKTTVEVQCGGKRQKLVYDIPVVEFPRREISKFIFCQN